MDQVTYLLSNYLKELIIEITTQRFLCLFCASFSPLFWGPTASLFCLSLAAFVSTARVAPCLLDVLMRLS